MFPGAGDYLRAVRTWRAVGRGAGGPSEASKSDSHGISVSNVDRSVKPGDDFYQYANGGWIERTRIPADRASVGVFTALSDLSNKRTVDLIEQAAKGNAPAASDTRKIADLYNSFMDEGGIEAKGFAALKPYLQSIAAIRDKKDLARALGESLRADVDALNNTNFHTANLFGLWVAPGFNDSDHYAAYLLQGGLQLPDREYYIADTDRMRDIRAKYQAHIAAMMGSRVSMIRICAPSVFLSWSMTSLKNTSVSRRTKTSIKPITPGNRASLLEKPPVWTGRNFSARLD